jgi:tetratricopeptide (TPR) repeat protein
MAVLTVLLTAALSAAINFSTGLPLPEWMTWARNPWVMWLVNVILVLLVAALTVLQQRLTDETDSAQTQTQLPSWADLGDSVAPRLGSLPKYVRGRESLLSSLERHRREGGLVVLVGAGGMGKSTVVREFVRRMQPGEEGGRRPPIWEVSAATPTSLISGLITVASALGATEEDLEAIATGLPTGPDHLWRLLEQGPKGWLLIVDNADETKTLARPVLPGAETAPTVQENDGWVRVSCRGLVLVTSRQRGTRAWPEKASIYTVGLLSEADAATILLDEARGGDWAQAKELARRLGRLPLALHLAGRYLGSEYVDDPSFDAYRRKLDVDPRAIRHLRRDPGDPENTERLTVMRTWELSLNALANHGLPEARPLLRLLSCCAPAVPVPVSLLKEEIVDPFLRAVMNGLDAAVDGSVASVDQVLRGLDRLGLIDPRRIPRNRITDGHRQTSETEMAVVMHPVITDTNRVYLLEPGVGDPPERLVRHTAVAILAAGLDSLTDDEPAAWPAFRSLTPHLQAILANSARRLDDDYLLTLTRITCHTGIAYRQMRAPNVGVDLADFILAEAQRRGLEPSPTLSMARQQQALLLSAVERNVKAEAVYQAILAEQLRRWPADDPTNLVIRHNLAVLAADQGRLDEAESALRDVLEEERRVLGEDNRHTLATRRALATLLTQRDKWEEATTALEKLLGDAIRVLGPDDPFTLATRHNVALATWHRGEPDEARTAVNRLLADERRLLGTDHYITAATATSHFETGDFLLPILYSTPKLREQLAVDLFNKGVSMTNNDRRADAVRTYTELLTRFADDPEPFLREVVANAYLNKAALLVKLGGQDGLDEAVRTYEELEERFGDDSQPVLRKLSAEGLIKQAIARHLRGDHDDALQTATRGKQRYHELAENNSESAEAELDSAAKLIAAITTELAETLLHKGNTMVQQERHEEAVASYDQLLQRFSDNPLPAIRRIVALALYNKAASLASLRTPEDDDGTP